MIERIMSEEIGDILKVQDVAVYALQEYMHQHDVRRVMPVMLSPITDPLCHSVYDASISYLGQELQLTKSMLLHKQMILGGGIDSIFVMSPNVRLEMEECRDSGRHLIEFSQLDIEFREYSKHDFMRFAEGMVVHAISEVKEKCGPELGRLGRELTIPSTPFKRYESEELSVPIEESEERLSKEATEPFWILNYTREFYDREDKDERGYYHNYDLVWPEGYGEALSGAEREYEHKEIVRKMKERKMDPGPYKDYLQLAKDGLLNPTAGGGLGIERFVRYLCGKKDIADVTLFGRKAGERVIF